MKLYDDYIPTAREIARALEFQTFPPPRPNVKVEAKGLLAKLCYTYILVYSFIYKAVDKGVLGT